jgi:phosphohistidine phosphatase
VKILLIRHAEAEDRANSQGISADRARRLTPRGRRTIRKGAKALCRMLPESSVVATSPLVRAQETAAIVARAFDVPVAELEALAPGGSKKVLLAWLDEQPRDASAVWVGHEPDMGNLASWLVAGSARGFVEFKKSAACLIEFDGRPRAGAGRLLWLLPPGVLRKLADA